MATAVRGSVRDAVRALFEGAPATVPLLAQASRLKVGTIEKLMLNESWVVAGKGNVRARLRKRLDALTARLVDLLDGATEIMEAGETLPKTQVETITAWIKVVDKVGEFTRGEDRVKENQTKTHEDTRTVLRRIDGQIRALAEDLAEKIVAEKLGKAAG